MPFNCLFF